MKLPIKRFFEVLPLHIKLEDCPLTVSRSIVTAPMFLQKRIKPILIWVLQTAHKNHWNKNQQNYQDDINLLFLIAAIATPLQHSVTYN